MSKKRWISTFFHNATIKRQLYTIYTAVVLVPILLLGTFLMMYIRHMMVNYYTELLKSDNYRVRNILFDITMEVYTISKDISFDNGVREILASEFDTRQEYVHAVDRNEVLSQYASTYAEVSKIEIYTDNPFLSDYKLFKRTSEEIENTTWYQQALTKSGVFWQQISWEDGYRDSKWDLCLVKKIPLVNSPYHAALVIHIDDNYLRMWVDSSEYISVMSVDRGPVFYSSDRERDGKAQPWIVDFDDPYFHYTGLTEEEGYKYFIDVSTFRAYQSGSRIYLCTLDQNGYANIRNILYLCGAIILTALVIPAILILIFTRYFTNRVNVLRQQMHKASTQDYELLASFHGRDELSEAFEDLQVMVQNIKEQEAKTYEVQLKEQELMIRQREMEFKMLASQINPHFLYNTLETIRMKALTAGDKEAATATKLLGKSMRYVLENTGTSFTTLEEELNHIDEYMEIQRLRFGDRVQYEKNVEDGLETSKYYILPLLLQPMVENAIVHGLEEVDEGGKIILSVYIKDMDGSQLLMIDVDDNGCGMDEETLSKLRWDIEVRDMSRSRSIGLYNINQRMKLHYGDGYRIHIYSEPGQGTRIRLIIPVDKCNSET